MNKVLFAKNNINSFTECVYDNQVFKTANKMNLWKKWVCIVLRWTLDMHMNDALLVMKAQSLPFFHENMRNRQKSSIMSLRSFKGVGIMKPGDEYPSFVQDKSVTIV